LAPTHRDMVGENIQLDLTLESSNPALSLTGVVVYAIDSGIGIRFEGVSPEQHASLRNYVQARGIGMAKRSPN